MHFKFLYLSEVLDVPGHDHGDVPVPEVVDDLGEVDVPGERPRDVLSDARRAEEAPRGALRAALVEELGVHVLLVEVDDRGALVGPQLGQLG